MFILIDKKKNPVCCWNGQIIICSTKEEAEDWTKSDIGYYKTARVVEIENFDGFNNIIEEDGDFYLN